MDTGLIFLVVLQLLPFLALALGMAAASVGAYMVARPRPFLPRSTTMFGLSPDGSGLRGVLHGMFVEARVEKAEGKTRTIVSGQVLDPRGSPDLGADKIALIHAGIPTDEQVAHSIAIVLERGRALRLRSPL